MKKKLFPMATAIPAAILLAACADTDVVDDMSSTKGEAAVDNTVSFSTYMSKKGSTRAGEGGNMTNKTLKGWKTKASEDGEEYTVQDGTGFGVFAYYTGKLTYGQHQRGTYSDEELKTEGAISVKYPNFMYNQEVSFEYTNKTDASETGFWTYEPLKYWPNDFSNDAVDQQTPPAQGSGENGGNVSFFAYAPYVTYDEATSATDNTYGITGMTANSEPGDPKITYTIGGNVDLLWGTFESTPIDGAAGETNLGVSHEDGERNLYKHAILKGNEEGSYTMAADLTKQKVDKQVKFNFKHALAGIGGSIPEGTGGESTKGGFKVVLDIDNFNNGAPSTSTTGGHRQEFTKEGKDYYRTIVTISSITIENYSDDVKVKNDNGEEKTASSKIYKKGTLNLATGKWTTDEKEVANGEFSFGQTITPGDPSTGGSAKPALNPEIAESGFDDNSILSWFEKSANRGVIEDESRNVYASSDVSPIMLIPGSEPIFKITVEYIVRQYDENLAKTYTEVTNKISKAVIFPKVKLNTHYSLVMHLGLTSVKFTAEVSAWAENNGTSGGDDEREDGVASDFKEVDLPSNEKDNQSGN